MSEGRRVRLAYFVARTACKQTVKSEGKRVRLTYLVVCTDESCHKVSEGRRVCLIFLVSRIANSYSETDDLLNVVGLALWQVMCDILTYRTAVLFGQNQDVRFWGLFQIRTDQMRSDHLGFKKNIYVLRFPQVQQRRTWWRLRLVNEEIEW